MLWYKVTHWSLVQLQKTQDMMDYSEQVNMTGVLLDCALDVERWGDISHKQKYCCYLFGKYKCGFNVLKAQYEAALCLVWGRATRYSE